MLTGRSRRPVGAAVAAVVAVAVAAAAWMAAPLTARAADAPPAHGFVGAEVQPPTLGQAQALGLPQMQGVFVRDLLSWGPAYAAGMRRGDLIIEYDGVPVTGLAQIVAVVQARPPGAGVPAVIWRRGQAIATEMVLGSFPAGWNVASESVAVVPRLGLRLRALTAQAKVEAGVRWGATGLLVVGVDDGTPAARLGLVPGDVLVAADGTELVAPAEADAMLSAATVLLVEGARGFRAVRLDGAPLAAVRTAAGAAWQPLAGQGLLVLDIAHGSPAAAAGLRSGDVVTAVAGAPAESVSAIAGHLTVATLGGGDTTVDLAATDTDAPPPERQEAAVALLGATVAALSPDAVAAHRLRPSARGVVVTAVDPAGHAAALGLRKGLVVVAVDQAPVATPAALASALDEAAARDAAEAVLLIEGPQGFRILSLPLRQPAAVAPASLAPAPLLQWNGGPQAN